MKPLVLLLVLVAAVAASPVAEDLDSVTEGADPAIQALSPRVPDAEAEAETLTSRAVGSTCRYSSTVGRPRQMHNQNHY